MHPSRAIAAFLLAVLAAAGCSLLAKKTPTPAADIPKGELESHPVPEGERYYTILFGSINKLRQPAHSHTWASMVRVKQLPGQVQPEVDVRTISWMPATLKIQPASRSVELGVNLSLEQSLKLARDDGQKIEMWGPYEMWHGFWERFSIQKAFLESGAVGYQCTDTWGEAARLGNGCDCIHAISDMDPQLPRSGYPLMYYGPPATGHLVRRIMQRGSVIDASHTNDWFLVPLNLTNCDIERREYRGRIKYFENN